MFLILSLTVVSVVYWFSVVLAEFFFDSEEEISLPLVIRTCFGFFFSILYFAAAWQVVSIPYAWLFGILLTFLYLYGKYGHQFISISVSRLRANIREHTKYFVVFLVGANIFFAPLLVANNFGPFTEGGGDVSIYADVTKLYADKNLTGKGDPGGLSEIGQNLKSIFYINFEDAAVVTERSAKRISSYGTSSLNPPLAESAVNRIRATQFMGSFLYTPYGSYYFLSGKNNYNVYYGIQAFLYCILLVGAWVFFRRFGKISAAIALLTILLSHGLISVFYNLYATQAFAIAFSILLLNALPYIRLNSWAGLRTYGVGIACLWAMYVHFLTLVLPLTALAWTSRFFNIFEKKETASAKPIGNSVYRKSCSMLSIGIFFCLLLILLLASYETSFSFFKSLTSSIFKGENNIYMGEAKSFFDWKSISFLFGILSQQHYLPFATEYSWLNWTVITGVGVGVCITLLGSFLVFKIYRSKYCNKKQRGFYALYLLLIAATAIHVYATQMSLYTQAKGAQNILVYVYVIVLLPLAMGLSFGDKDVVIKKLTKTLLISVILFCVAMAVPRVVFGLKLAFGQDRAAILEPSYFQEADKIMNSDSMPFVLFEPRKSADLYLSIQPFFGARMVSTRHLILQVSRESDISLKKEVLANELIETKDVPHLWLLYAEKKAKWPTLGVFDYKWKSERLADKKDPDILLFAHDYERNFGERIVDVTTAKTGKFSYLRNGAAMLYLPSGREGSLEVTLEPRDEKNYDAMVKEVRERLEKGEMSSNVSMEADGKFVRLKSKVAAEGKQTLHTIARYSNEFWLNVTVNGKDL